MCVPDVKAHIVLQLLHMYQGNHFPGSVCVPGAEILSDMLRCSDAASLSSFSILVSFTCSERGLSTHAVCKPGGTVRHINKLAILKVLHRSDKFCEVG